MNDQQKLAALGVLVDMRREYLEAIRETETIVEISICGLDNGIQIMEDGATDLLQLLGKQKDVEKLYDNAKHICYGFRWQDTLFFWLEEK
jgi:hypothetical protein